MSVLTDKQIEGIDLAMDESILLDVTVDRSLRTARLILEVFSIDQSGRIPEDRQVTISLKSISRIAGALGSYDNQRRFQKTELLTIDTLEGVIKSFNGSSMYGDLLARNDDKLPKWFDATCFDVRFDSSRSDLMMDIFQDHGPERLLEVRFWCDEVVIFRQEEEVSVDEFIADGKRWWDAFNEDDPRTRGFGMYPLK